MNCNSRRFPALVFICFLLSVVCSLTTGCLGPLYGVYELTKEEKDDPNASPIVTVSDPGRQYDSSNIPVNFTLTDQDTLTVKEPQRVAHRIRSCEVLGPQHEHFAHEVRMVHEVDGISSGTEIDKVSVPGGHVHDDVQILPGLPGRRDRGGSTVREVMRDLPDGKRRAYTTVLTILQLMEKKGLVSHTRKGLAYLYHPEVNRDEVVAPVMRTLLKNVFGGDPSAVVQSLLDCGDVDAEQVREIRRVINAAARKAPEEDPS